VLSCRTCRYAVLDATPHCRANPPTPVAAGGSSAFPVIKLDDWWCGEYERASPRELKVREKSLLHPKG
jgi:hypothetical protein